MEIHRSSFCDYQYQFYQFWAKNIEKKKMGEAKVVVPLVPSAVLTTDI